MTGKPKASSSAASPRTRVAAVAAVALIGLVVLWFALRSRTDPGPASAPSARSTVGPSGANGPSGLLPSVDRATDQLSTSEPVPGTREVAPGIFETTMPPTPYDPEAEARFREQMRGAADIYNEFSIYPPWSRPFDGSQQHLLDWNPSSSHEQAIAEDKDGEIRVAVELDRVSAGPGESLAVLATAWRVGPGDTRSAVPFAVRGEIRTYDESKSNPAQETTGYEAGWIKVADLGFTEDKDPMRQTATFVPSQVPALAAGPHDSEVVAWVHAGGNVKPFSLRFRYAAIAPFEVLRGAGDRIDDGSLAVKLAVRAKEAGSVRVTAVLFDAAGTVPIAVFDNYVQLASKGEQTMTLTFFGLAIRDKGVDGPYTIRALHGHVLRGELEVPWSYVPVLTTKAYKHRDFSDQEWWSQERADKIDSYNRVIDE